MKNIKYKSDDISEFYKTNRMNYEDFYPSEKIIIESILKGESNKTILDIGCACGGLGKALSDNFNISSYTGIDINTQAIEWAKDNNKLNIPHNYIDDDILKSDVQKADIVFSLSCADWNIQTDAIIKKSWDCVNDGGYLIMSLRLTKEQSINDVNKSYQYIDFFHNNNKKEKANYTIFNIIDILKIFNNLTPKPSNIDSYGYYGTPSSTACIPYDKLLFAVFAVKKDKLDLDTKLNLKFPLDIFI